MGRMSLNLKFFENIETRSLLIGSAVVGLYVTYSIYKWYSSTIHVNNLNRKVRARLQIRAQQIEQIRELTADLDIELEEKIAALKVEDLLEAIKEGEYSCSDVLKTYQRRSLRSQELTNCMTEYILDASSVAKNYDVLSQNPNYEAPPLFGLPISIKANVSLKGYDQFKGYVQDLEHAVEEDSILVQHLRELGAIPFILTNVPQTLLTYSCENSVYGSTSHPLNIDRTSGGSSGGEAALISTGGSLVGIGSDIGGSIRIPASFCGIVGFKPFSKRISVAGASGSVPGRSHVFGSSGPMSRDVSGCVSILRAFWSRKWIHNNDAYIPPVDFNEEMYQSTEKLRIGYFDTNNYLEPVPVMKRAVHETRELLESKSHELILFEPPNVKRAHELFLMAVALDNGKWIIDRLKTDLPVKGYNEMFLPLKLPFWLRSFLSYTLRGVNRRAADAIGNYHRNTHELLLVYNEIEQYWATWKKLMKEKNLDCFICPIFPIPAMRHKEPYKLTFNCSYTGLFNLLDYPSGTVPVTKVMQSDINDLQNYIPGDYFESLLLKSAKGLLDFPVGVQVVSLPYRDEMVLRIMKEIETSIREQ